MNGCPECVLDDEMLTMRPHPASTMSGSTAWMVWNTPFRLTSITLDHSWNDMCENFLKPSTPAALTSTRIGPNSSRIAAMAAVDLRAVGDVGDVTEPVIGG